MSTGRAVPTLHLARSQDGRFLVITLDGCGEDASELTLPLKQGVEAVEYALKQAAEGYRTRVSPDESGVVVNWDISGSVVYSEDEE